MKKKSLSQQHGNQQVPSNSKHTSKNKKSNSHKYGSQQHGLHPKGDKSVDEHMQDNWNKMTDTIDVDSHLEKETCLCVI